MTDAKSIDILITGIGETMAAPSAGESPVPMSSEGSSPSIAGTMGAQRIAGRYEVLSMLGAGGMGTVYRARDVELDELVALKVLHRELVDAPGMLARFRQEAKLARRVTHRNVARTFDIGEHAGEKFLTMEFVDGESLASVAARRGRLPLAEVLHVVEEVCAGMMAAHAAGVVHRDLKPDNVLVGTDGRIVVTDFGIAHAAAGAAGAAKTLGGVVGTPAYMAPEQVEASAEVDARADLYALGAMTYELITGDRAWPGDALFAVANARLINPPPDPRAVLPGLHAAVAEVVMRCMARRPADRYATADEVAVALGRAVAATTTPSAALAPTSLGLLVAPHPALGSPAHDAATDKTIAVLPFANGGAPEDAYLADGMTEDLIDVLSMTPGLRVRPRGAVAHLQGKEGDPRQVGAELGVQVIVHGSVRKTPAGIRVTARVVSTSDGFQLWAKRFDRPAAEVLAVNDEAARAIAEALTVTAGAKARVAPTDPLAIDLYLRAQHEHHKVWRDDALRAVDLYEQALARAPNDATILAASARARVRVAFFGGAGAAEALAKAREGADRAVAGAPDRGEAWVALAAARMMGGDPAGAVRAAVTALEKSRGLAPAHDLLGRILIEVGRTDEAISHLRTAMSIDPTEMLTRFELARAYALLGRPAEADALLDLPVTDLSTRVTRFVYRTRVSLWRGEIHPELDDPPEVGFELGTLSDMRSLVEVMRTRELPDAYRERLEASARSGEAGSRRRALFHQRNAELYAYVFEVDHALESIAQAVTSGLLDVVWMDRCPVFDPVRADPRFAPLREEVSARAGRVVAALARP